MVDAAIGPIGTYGYGARVKGSFSGFESEITPGYAIGKVELALYSYAVRTFTKTVKFQLYLGGSRVAEFKPTGAIFNNVIGAGNAGLVYYDITGMRAWTWADFGNNLQIVIDQSGVNSGDVVYYDAVGLRVTSVPGSDTTAEGAPTNLPKAAIDTSRLLNVYNFAVRATDVWNEAPAYLQGQGVTVAVVDSGAVKNKDLGGRLIAKVNFNAAYHDSNDRYGHGTFVATLIGGDGIQSGGQYVGIAPKTNIVNVRISDDQGMATESDVINALQWVLEKKTRYSIRVVNLSLNSSVAQSYHTSPLDAACEILWFNGIVVVVSAGNNGSADLYPPANDPFVITVGATDDKGTVGLGDDTVASFSAYGTVENGVAKPELVAPGKNIVALLGDNRRLTIGQEHPANRIGDHYFRMSGTSMAAPMVSGAVALLLQDEPGLTPDQVKYRLMATAVHDPAVWPGYDPVKAGAGYLDIYAAVHGTSTESANTGLVASQLLWTGTEPVTWDSVNWNSVNWNSVNWNSVNWNSVNWNSVNWNSDYWGN
jgi:serine protease AprX